MPILSHTRRHVLEITLRRAAAVHIGFLPVFHEKPYCIVALPFEQKSRHRAVDASAHSDDNRFRHRVYFNAKALSCQTVGQAYPDKIEENLSSKTKRHRRLSILRLFCPPQRFQSFYNLTELCYNVTCPQSELKQGNSRPKIRTRSSIG